MLSIFELMLKICSYFIKITEGLTCRLIRKSKRIRNDENLAEVITVKEFTLLESGSDRIHQNESIFILPGQVNASLEIENLEDD